MDTEFSPLAEAHGDQLVSGRPLLIRLPLQAMLFNTAFCVRAEERGVTHHDGFERFAVHVPRGSLERSSPCR